MELSGLLPVLVLFILLVGVRETGLVEGSLRDSCPKIKENCKYRERSHCQKHRDCPTKMKCCDLSCGKKCINSKQDLCSLPEDRGPCVAFLPRWWYDKVVNFCIAFIYGGCLGNNNNFQSEDICMKDNSVFG
ncbi:WAP four-disulfide core domain protein 6A-like [Talpa occidentalis]|uniref:WAP four-disulfide core domain protein 6A-like n=1 Tax=Talpa occidentalis TaxID=50954 RepID=UPI00188ED9F1|nr:WAP four-disulfide core domain protein 6A-like [Talpa occidentalis]